MCERDQLYAEIPLFHYYFLASCVSINDTKYGIQENQMASLPARIAVMSCQTWPNTARMHAQPISNVSIKEQERLCKDV